MQDTSDAAERALLDTLPSYDSVQRFQWVAHATTDAIWDWNLETDAIWWSEGMQTLFGVPPEQLPPDSSSWTLRLHPDDSAAVLQSIHGAIHGSGIHWSAQYRFRRQDDSYVWVLDRGFVIRNAQGRALRMVGGMSDISAQKEADALARREAQTHAALVQVQQKMASPELALPDMLALVAQTALLATGASGAMVDIQEGPHRGAHAWAGQKIPLYDPVLRDSLLWLTLKKGHTVLCNNTLDKGCNLGDTYPRQGVRAILAVPLHIDGAVVGALQALSEHSGIFSPRDLAHLEILSESLGTMVQLRQVTSQLQASEQQYKLLFDAHPQPMWVSAQDGNQRILAVNQAMLEHYGYSAEELVRMNMHDLLAPAQEEPQGATKACVPCTQRQGFLCRHRRKDGTVIDVELSSRSIDFNGRPACQVMATDVSERLRAEQALARMARARHLLSACNETLVRATSETAMLQAICRIAVDIGGYRLGWIGFVRNDAYQSIEIVAHAGLDENYLETLHPSWSETNILGQGPAGIAVRTGQPVIGEDLHDDEKWARWSGSALKRGLQGVISLPLRQAEHTFGLLYLYASEVLQISQEESQLLQELASDLAFGIMSLRAHKEQQRLQASVLKMAASLSAATGTEFFVQLVRNMTEALEAQVGCVARLPAPEEGQAQRAVTLATVFNGELRQSEEFLLQESPSLKLATQSQYVVTHNLEQLCASTPDMLHFQAQGYAGQQLCDSAGVPVGIIFVLFRQPITHPEFIASTLQIFATRAAAELNRQVAEARIRRQASLLDKAQDAIVVRDTEHRITFWNKSAERIYGWPQWQVLGQPITTLLYQDLSAFYRATEIVLTTGEWAGEITQYHRNGHPIEMEGRWTLVRGDDGQPESILAINNDIGQRKAAEREIKRLAFYDALTGLPNRMLLMDRMHHALGNAQRQQQGGALLFIDLDNFKTLNDTLGHDKGDLLLQQVAQRLNACVRSADTVARLGGDEFVVMLEGLNPHPNLLALEARTVGEKILTTLSAPYELDGYQYRSTPSIGIAPFQGEHMSVGDLLKQADMAMYQSKAAGRSTLRFFDPHMQSVVTERAALESDLREALAKNQFLLHYQPQVDSLGQYVGVEALVRWVHPERGLVSPMHFIPLAEETGLILTLGNWVLHTACAQLARWRSDPLLQHLTMAVNVSSRQFRNSSFVDDVAQALTANEAPAHLLKLELTESLLVEDMDIAISTMTTLRLLGVSFSLDDFGTGYSSLSYLKRMPLHQLKIDQSFVRDLLTDPNDAAIVNTIIALSRSLGLNVIAEGVETIEQRDLLLQAGCLNFQGYLFSRPVPADELELLLRGKSA